MNTYDAKITTRYQETDQMGIIYHSNYFVYFDVGRTEFFKNRATSYKAIEEAGVILPVIDVGCRYKVSAKFDDDLIVRTSIAELRSTRIKFKYDLIREEDGKLLANGFTEHAFINNGRPINLKKNYNDLYEKLVEVFSS